MNQSSVSRRCSKRFPIVVGAFLHCDDGAPSQTATTPARAPHFHRVHTLERLLGSGIYITVCLLAGTVIAHIGMTIMEVAR